MGSFTLWTHYLMYLYSYYVTRTKMGMRLSKTFPEHGGMCLSKILVHTNPSTVHHNQEGKMKYKLLNPHWYNSRFPSLPIT